MEHRLLLSAVANASTPSDVTWTAKLFATELTDVSFPLTLIPAAGAPENLTDSAASTAGSWFRVDRDNDGQADRNEPWALLTQTAPIQPGQNSLEPLPVTLSPGDLSQGGAIQLDSASVTLTGYPITGADYLFHFQPTSASLNSSQGSLTFGTNNSERQPQSSPAPFEMRVASEGGWIAMSFSAFDPQADAPPIAGMTNVSAPRSMLAPEEIDVRIKGPAEPTGLEASRAQSQAFELSEVVHPSLDIDVEGELAPDASEQRLRAVDLVLEEEFFDDIAAESLAPQPASREAVEAPKMSLRTAPPVPAGEARDADPAALGVIWPGDPAYATRQDIAGEPMLRDEDLVLLGLPIASRIDGPTDLPPGMPVRLVQTIAEVLASSDLMARVESVLAYRADEVSLAQELGLVLIIHQVHRVHNSLLAEELRKAERFNPRPLTAMA